MPAARARAIRGEVAGRSGEVGVEDDPSDAEIDRLLDQAEAVDRGPAPTAAAAIATDRACCGMVLALCFFLGLLLYVGVGLIAGPPWNLASRVVPVIWVGSVLGAVWCLYSFGLQKARHCVATPGVVARAADGHVDGPEGGYDARLATVVYRYGGVRGRHRIMQRKDELPRIQVGDFYWLLVFPDQPQRVRSCSASPGSG